MIGYEIFITIFHDVFPRILKFLEYFCSLSARLFEYFFLCSESERRYSDAFLVAISCSFGSYGEQGVFGVEMFLYDEFRGIVLIVEFRVIYRLSPFVSFSIL